MLERAFVLLALACTTACATAAATQPTLVRKGSSETGPRDETAKNEVPLLPSTVVCARQPLSLREGAFSMTVDPGTAMKVLTTRNGRAVVRFTADTHSTTWRVPVGAVEPCDRKVRLEYKKQGVVPTQRVLQNPGLPCLFKSSRSGRESPVYLLTGEVYGEVLGRREDWLRVRVALVGATIEGWFPVDDTAAPFRPRLTKEYAAGVYGTATASCWHPAQLVLPDDSDDRTTLRGDASAGPPEGQILGLRGLRAVGGEIGACARRHREDITPAMAVQVRLHRVGVVGLHALALGRAPSPALEACVMEAVSQVHLRWTSDTIPMAQFTQPFRFEAGVSVPSAD